MYAGRFQHIPKDEIPGIRLGSIPDQFRCTAKSKSTGERCRCMRVTGQGVCRHHGARKQKPTWAKRFRQASRLRGERPDGYHSD
jgi:hypothetical protein